MDFLAIETGSNFYPGSFVTAFYFPRMVGVLGADLIWRCSRESIAQWRPGEQQTFPLKALLAESRRLPQMPFPLKALLADGRRLLPMRTLRGYTPASVLEWEGVTFERVVWGWPAIPTDFMCILELVWKLPRGIVADPFPPPFLFEYSWPQTSESFRYFQLINQTEEFTIPLLPLGLSILSVSSEVVEW